MIRNWGIRNRVLLLALLPIISMGMVLGGYFIRSRVHDLKSSQSALGHAIVKQLAQASKYGLLTDNPVLLEALARTVAQEDNIESVTITDNKNHSLAQVVHSIPPGHGLINSIARNIGAKTGFEGALTFTQPIVLQTAPTGESNKQTAQNAVRVRPSATTSETLGQVTVKLSEVHFAERQAQIIVNGGLILLICLVFSILLALVISGSVVAPIGRIIAMVGRFSSGNHSMRVPEVSGGELGRLEQGINQMAANAQRSQQELQEQVDQATSELRGTLEEMEIKSVELDLARKRAVEASRVKSEFLANMSHEIRTPMNAVVGFSDLLTKTPLNEGQRNYLTAIRQSANMLLALLDNVLSAARLETSKPDIQVRSFLLRDLLEEIVQIGAMDAYAKRLELILHMQGDNDQPLLGDRILLTRALSNLVMNAIKFTDTGSIVIYSHSKPQGLDKVDVEIQIIDTGIGISDQDQRRLFEPFFQVDSSTNRSHGGAGLGLYITKKLIEQLGGSLILTSVPGHGSEFRVSLTFSCDDAVLSQPLLSNLHSVKSKPLLVYEPQLQASDALLSRLEHLGLDSYLVSSQQHLREILQVRNPRDAYSAVLLSLGYDDLREPALLDTLLTGMATGFPALVLVNSVNAEVQADISRRIDGPCLSKSITELALGEQLSRLLDGAPAAIPANDVSDGPILQGANVIVADDNRINRLLARILLEKCGANVLEAKSGQEIVNLLFEHSVNLILLDMHMPGEDGWQVAKRLNSEPFAHLSIPIIALSATRNQESAQILAEHGLADWLTKPLEEDMLREAVMKYIRPGITVRQHEAGSGSRDSGDIRTILADLRPPIRQMLMEDLPMQWRAIETAWQSRNLQQLKEQVHKLNGSAAFCKLVRLRDVCEQLENYLRDRQETEIPHLIVQLAEEVRRTIAQLDNLDVRLAADS
ncbi:MAG: ATP-binding protein [Gammaproteobacteria bacterium]